MIDPVCLLDSYVASVSDFLIKHHVDSYNQYVNDRIPTIVKQFNPYRVRTPDEEYDVLVFVGGEDSSALYFDRPMIVDHASGGSQRPMTPQDAREFNLSYTFELKADVLLRIVHIRTGDVVERMLERLHVASIPILLRSDVCMLRGLTGDSLRRAGECPYDLGGYFIIDGKEKVIVSQEKIRDHVLFDLNSDFTESRFSIRCTSEEDRLFPKEHVFTVTYGRHRKHPGAIRVSAPNTKQGDRSEPVPIAMMFRALGVETDRDIAKLLYPEASHRDDTGESDFSNVPNSDSVERYLHACFKDAQDIRTQDQAIQELSAYSPLGTKEHALLRLTNDFMPHAGRHFGCKALVLADLVRTVIQRMASREHVDRDSMRNKRLNVTGFLMTYITRDFVNRWRLGAMRGIVQEYMHGTWKGGADISKLITSQNAASVFSPTYIDKQIRANFKTNKRWAIRKDPDDQESIVQDLKRVSYLSTVSHLRRVNTPADRNSSIVEPHALHTTHWGVMCPTETPDGSNIGLLKHLAMLVYITFDLGNEAILTLLIRECDLVTLDRLWQTRNSRPYVEEDVKVTINSVWVGVVPLKDAAPIAEYMRLRRRCGQLSAMTSVSLDVKQRMLNFGTEEGRCARPLLIVQDAKTVWETKIKNENDVRPLFEDWWRCVHPRGSTGVSFDKDSSHERHQHGERAFENARLLRQLREQISPLEFLDVEEADTSALIALRPADITSATTHCEIHPQTILGWVAANQPFINHIPAPRAQNATGNTKQAIGVFASSFRRRKDTEGYVLLSGQRPLVATTQAKFVNQLTLPAGVNLMLAITPLTGYNQEDALIINRSAVERGALVISVFHTVTASETKETEFYDPSAADADAKKALFDYSAVDSSGVCGVETRIHDRSTLFAMRDRGTRQDVSVTADNFMGGHVHRVSHVVDPETGYRTSSVVVRSHRDCTVGDKIALRYYQKGIVALLVPEYEMPFTSDGITPDIVMNTLALPKRMTVGQLLESCLATVCCTEGRCAEIVPFESELSPPDTQHELFCPVDGERFPETTMLGPVFCLRMKQQVCDKIGFRSYGKVDTVTHQGSRGRTQDGAQRLGEMELAAVSAHGISCFQQEAFVGKSDGQIISYDDEGGWFPGTLARSAKGSRSVVAPRAFDIFVHEVVGLGVGMKLKTNMTQ